MAQDYKVTAVSQETRSFETKFGSMISYKLKLDGVDTPVELAQKSTTPAPTEGTVLHGHIEETSFGPKFKKEQPQGQGFGGSPATRSQGGASSKSFQSDPFTMYLSYAKDIKVAEIAAGRIDAKVSYDELLDDVLVGAKVLYEGRPGNETSTQDALPEDEDIKAGEPVDLSKIPF